MIKYIFIHHSGGIGNDSTASSQNLKVEDINAYHKLRWNFKSSMGSYVGYNFFINKEGKITQCRAVGEETASQKFYNSNSMSICLAGNFNHGSPDVPTEAQKTSLKTLLNMALDGKLKDTYKVISDTNFSMLRIHPHRKVGMTDCNGTKLSDNWARDLLFADMYLKWLGYPYIINLIAQSQKAIYDIKEVGGDSKSCDGFIDII